MLRTRVSYPKLFGLLIVLILIMSVLLSCGPGETPTTPTTPTTPGATTTPQAPAEKIIWRANSIVAGGTNPDTTDAVYGELIRQITQRTGGRLEIQTHWNNELGFGHRDILKVLNEGLVEIGDLPISGAEGYAPEVGYESIPLHLGLAFPGEKVVDIHKALRPIYDELLAEWNGKRLATFYHRPMVEAPTEISASKPLQTLADFKGITMRNWSPVAVAFWANFGVKGVIFSMPEVYMAYKTGMIEATNLARTSYRAYKLYEVAKYLIVYYPGRSSSLTYGWAASTLHWPKLPPDIQKVVVDAYREYEATNDAINGDPNYRTPEDEWVIQTIKDYGITIITLSPEDQAQIQALADRQAAEWLVKTNDRGRELLKASLEALGRPDRYNDLLELGKQIIGSK